MSHESTTTFMERAAEFINDHEGMSYITSHAERLLDEGRYEELARFINEIEADQSREHFHDNGLV